MKMLSTLLFCSAILASDAFAAETGPALPAGKPAGVKQAQVENAGRPWLWIGLGAAAAAVVIATSGGSGHTTSTTGTGG